MVKCPKLLHPFFYHSVWLHEMIHSIFMGVSNVCNLQRSFFFVGATMKRHCDKKQNKYEIPDNDDNIEMINKGDEFSEWVGMPEFEASEKDIKIVITFATEELREEYAKKHNKLYLKHPHSDPILLQSKQRSYEYKVHF